MFGKSHAALLFIAETVFFNYVDFVYSSILAFYAAVKTDLTFSKISGFVTFVIPFGVSKSLRNGGKIRNFS